MNFNILGAALSVSFLSGCISETAAFDIRSSVRPDYARTISPVEIDSFLKQGGVLVDVRLSEDFAEEPILIPGAVRVDPENTEYWRSANKNAPVAVYCVKGKWVSQKTAAYISNLGFEAYSLDGGFVAYQEFAQSKE